MRPVSRSRVVSCGRTDRQT